MYLYLIHSVGICFDNFDDTPQLDRLLNRHIGIKILFKNVKI